MRSSMLGILDSHEIEEVLAGEAIGRIGCLADGHVYVVPITYAYDGECIYAHSGEGTKLRGMREHPEVCFEVEHVDDLARWRSVIAWGRFEELRGEDAARGMQVLQERLRPRMVSETARPTHGAQASHQGAVIYRIRLRERSGRFER